VFVVDAGHRKKQDMPKVTRPVSGPYLGDYVALFEQSSGNCRIEKGGVSCDIHLCSSFSEGNICLFAK